MADCGTTACTYWCTGVEWFPLAVNCGPGCDCNPPTLPCSLTENNGVKANFPCVSTTPPPPESCDAGTSLWRCVGDAWDFIKGDCPSCPEDCVPIEPTVACLETSDTPVAGTYGVLVSSSTSSSSSSSSTGCDGDCPEDDWRHTAELVPGDLRPPTPPKLPCGGLCDLVGLSGGVGETYQLTVPTPILADYVALAGIWDLDYVGTVSGYSQWQTASPGAYWRMRYLDDVEVWSLLGVLPSGDTVEFLVEGPFYPCDTNAFVYATHTAAGVWTFPLGVGVTSDGEQCMCCNSSSSSGSDGCGGLCTVPGFPDGLPDSWGMFVETPSSADFTDLGGNWSLGYDGHRDTGGDGSYVWVSGDVDTLPRWELIYVVATEVWYLVGYSALGTGNIVSLTLTGTFSACGDNTFTLAADSDAYPKTWEKPVDVIIAPTSSCKCCPESSSSGVRSLCDCTDMTEITVITKMCMAEGSGSSSGSVVTKQRLMVPSSWLVDEPWCETTEDVGCCDGASTSGSTSGGGSSGGGSSGGTCCTLPDTLTVSVTSTCLVFSGASQTVTRTGAQTWDWSRTPAPGTYHQLGIVCVNGLYSVAGAGLCSDGVTAMGFGFADYAANCAAFSVSGTVAISGGGGAPCCAGESVTATASL